MSRTEPICAAAIGIAVCCALSMRMRIPLGIGHISVDLGYLALAVYAYAFGSISAAVVGGCSAAVVGGCSAAVMSVLAGWFSPEWILANMTVGLICGRFYDRTDSIVMCAGLPLARRVHGIKTGA